MTRKIEINDKQTVGSPESHTGGWQGGNGEARGEPGLPTKDSLADELTSYAGAILGMDNAVIKFEGSGSISGNKVTDCSTAGSSRTGIFLQGSGQLTFILQADNDIYTIQDDIADEAGAVRSVKTTSVTGNTGLDGLSTDGGDGVWNIEQTGGGKLVINGQNLLSGDMTIEGILDLSNCSNTSGSNSFKKLTLENGATLLLTPASAVTGLKVTSLSLLDNATIHLNGNSRIVITENVSFPPDEFSITLDSTGFELNKPVQVITWSEPLSTIPTINVNKGYQCSVSADMKSINITKIS